MEYTSTVLTTYKDINEQHWNAVCKDNDIFMTLSFLKAIEISLKTICTVYYVLFYKQEKPVACTVFSEFKLDIGILASNIIKTILKVIRFIFPNFLKIGIVFCGLPVSIGQDWIRFKKDIDISLLLKSMDNLLQDLAEKRKKALIIFKEPRNPDVFDCLTGQGYIKGNSLPMHFLKSDYMDFDHYCSGLKSRYRNKIKKAVRIFQTCGCRIEQLTSVEDILRIYNDRTHQLYINVVGKSENKLEILPPDFFTEVAKNLPGQVLLTLMYKDDSIVGFNYSVFTESDFYFLFAGIDYQLNKESNLYFNLMYNVLDYAFKLNVQSIQMGQTADDFKAGLGCYTNDLFIYLKGRTGLLHFIFRLFFKQLVPEPEVIKEYHPFKEAE